MVDTIDQQSFKKQRIELTDIDKFSSPLLNMNVIEATPQKPSTSSKTAHLVVPLVPHLNFLNVPNDECQSLTPMVSEALSSATNRSEDDVAERYNEVLGHYQELHEESKKKWLMQYFKQYLHILCNSDKFDEATDMVNLHCQSVQEEIPGHPVSACDYVEVLTTAMNCSLKVKDDRHMWIYEWAQTNSHKVGIMTLDLGDILVTHNINPDD